MGVTHYTLDAVWLAPLLGVNHSCAVLRGNKLLICTDTSPPTQGRAATPHDAQFGEGALSYAVVD